MSWGSGNVVNGSHLDDASRRASTGAEASPPATSEFSDPFSPQTEATKPTNVLLSKIMSNFRRMRHAQKSIYAMDHPESIFNNEVPARTPSVAKISESSLPKNVFFIIIWEKWHWYFLRDFELRFIPYCYLGHEH